MKMALGIQTESGGGNFTPTVKINSKQGRVYRVDRKEEGGVWTTDEVEITKDFQFVPDLDNLEIGWMFFKAGQAPDLRMVKLGEVMADRPAGADADGKPNFKQGVRLLLKLGKSCGGDLRELAATAKSILGPIDKLHDDYLAGAKDHPGQLPQVRMSDMKKVDLKTQHGTNTNFEPVFEIVGWVDRARVFGDAAEEPKAETKTEPKSAAKEEPKQLVNAGGEEF
jgi:hypothetical protein